MEAGRTPAQWLGELCERLEGIRHLAELGERAFHLLRRKDGANPCFPERGLETSRQEARFQLEFPQYPDELFVAHPFRSRRETLSANSASAAARPANETRSCTAISSTSWR